MARSDFRTSRLYVDQPLATGELVPLDRDRANYLGNVMRLSVGDVALVFNGRDGEWRSVIEGGKRLAGLRIGERSRVQTKAADLAYVFAPLKHARLDYMVQKAVEMGVSTLCPVLTQHTQMSRINLERMRANVIEAAEQCGILNVADVVEPKALDAFLNGRDTSRLLVFCDEEADIANPAAALTDADASRGIDVLVGPEGGFANEERASLVRQPLIRRLSLGPRILRADTAAVAALTVVQTALGDWDAGHRR